MTKVQLLSLELSKFKGIHHFKLDANGSDVQIYGDNATGKTTIADAFNWILFDKDTANQKDFEIKTRVDGEQLKAAEHSVTVELLINQSKTKLQKIHKEKWTKKKGALNAEFNGHVTDYFVDDVPTKKKDYDALIKGIINEDIFKLLTSPNCFNGLKWKERRDTLLALVGDITNDDIFAQHKDLKIVESLLDGKSEENFRKMVQEQQRKIKNEMDSIPARIAENQNQLTGSTDDTALQKQLEAIESDIEASQQQIFNIKNGSAVTAKKQELYELENDMKTYANNFTYESQNNLTKLQVKLQEEQANLMNLQSPVRNANQEIKSIEQSIIRHNNWIEKLVTERKELLAKWHKKNKEEFQHQDACVCPTCEQEMPADKVDAARQKAEEEFNLAKSKILADITAEGKGIASNMSKVSEEIGTLETQKEKLQIEIEESNVLIAKKEEAIAKLQKQIADAQSTAPDVTKDAQYQEMKQSIANLQNSIRELQEHAQQAIADVEIELADHKGRKSEINAEIAKIANEANIKKRITELDTKEEMLGKEYQRLAEQLYAVERFTRAKVELLEEKINSRFKIARFKLFNTQVNGGIEECCETIVNGVSYSGGLNNAMKINVGLDIINTLSAHYETSAPIFIDNAESVTQLLEVEAQTIALVVSEQDKDLRIEVAEREVSIQ